MSDSRESRRARLLQLLAEHDVRCPSCAYTLRGLDGVQCPECGWVFDEVLLRDQLAPPPRWPLPTGIRLMTLFAILTLIFAQLSIIKFSKITGPDLIVLAHGVLALGLAVYWFGTTRRASRYTFVGCPLRLGAVWALLAAAVILARALR